MKRSLLRRLGMDWVDVGLIVVLIGVCVLVFVPWESWFK